MKSKSSVKQTAVEHTSVLTARLPTELKPRPGNPRIHSEKQLFKLKRSIVQFGFTTAVLVDEDSVILCGHGRVQAAIELGLKTIPTRVIAGLTEAEKRAYVIADNKLSQLSSWDTGLLKAEMELLMDADIGIESTAFSTAEVDIMFDAPAESTKGDPMICNPLTSRNQLSAGQATFGRLEIIACYVGTPWKPLHTNNYCRASRYR